MVLVFSGAVIPDHGRVETSHCTFFKDLQSVFQGPPSQCSGCLQALKAGKVSLLLLLLSRFSLVRLSATLQTAAHQAPPPLGFSSQEHWSGLPFPYQCMEVKSESEVAQSCPTLSDLGCSLPGSSVHGIFQATVWSS